MITNILGAVAAILKWLFSPEQVRKRELADELERNQDLRDAVATDNDKHISDIIDELRQKYSIRQRNK